MVRPTTMPQWASNNVTLPQAAIPNKAQPTIDLRETGFDLFSLPEAQEENFWRNLVYLWVEHLDGVLGTSLGVATAAEAQAFTVNRLIDGAGLAQAFQGNNHSLSSTGYQILPGGLIIQWGAATVVPSGTTVTLPIAFPSSIYIAIATPTSIADMPIFIGSAPTTTAIVLDHQAQTNITANWIAIGT